MCNLIANQGIDNAHQCTKHFLDIIRETTHKIVTDKQRMAIFKIFSFLNWAFANGVWSNISNTTLRRDLMEQSIKSIVLSTAYDLSENKSTEDVAFIASDLDLEFRKMVLSYIERINELGKDGIETNANTATLVGLECIQNILNLNDDEMNVIVVVFKSRVKDIATIEEIAAQINKVECDKK